MEGLYMVKINVNFVMDHNCRATESNITIRTYGTLYNYIYWFYVSYTNEMQTEDIYMHIASRNKDPQKIPKWCCPLQILSIEISLLPIHCNENVLDKLSINNTSINDLY
jgi:hypothetical protein